MGQGVTVSSQGAAASCGNEQQKPTVADRVLTKSALAPPCVLWSQGQLKNIFAF